MAKSLAIAPLGPISGVPRHISGFLRWSGEAPRAATLQLLDDGGKSLGEPAAVTLRSAADTDLVRLRTRLDHATPPGRYTARLHVGAESYPLSLEVAPVAGLFPQPSTLTMRGAPGEALAADFVLLNRGNVEAVIPDAAAVGIFDDDGVENAFARAYRTDSDDGLEIFKTFVVGLRQAHGGLLKLKVEDGAGPLPPRAARAVRIATTLPSKLASGRVYSGHWTLANLNYAVEVAVTGSVETDRTDRRRAS